MKIFTFISICVLVVSAWLSWPFSISEAKLTDGQLAARGQYGDSFGPLNTLFTGLAFAGVAFSIYLQLTAEKKRLAERKKDEFENRLFHLTDALRSHVSSMDVKGHDDTVYRGKDCFKGIIIHLLHVSEKEHPGKDRPSKVIVDAYSSLYSGYQDDLGPYFRMLYHTFRFINRSGLKDKEEYADFVRAELSSGELCLLEINGLTEKGKKFKDLIEIYNITKHAPRNTKFDPGNAISKEYKIRRTEA